MPSNPLISGKGHGRVSHDYSTQTPAFTDVSTVAILQPCYSLPVVFAELDTVKVPSDNANQPWLVCTRVSPKTKAQMVMSRRSSSFSWV